MLRIKSAKIIFVLAVSLFVAKPFLGFDMVSPNRPPAEDNIFIKVFSKRKLEYDEDSIFNMYAIHKKLADPVQRFLLRFSFLLGILFPVVIVTGANISNRFLRRIQLSLAQREPAYLLDGKLII